MRWLALLCLTACAPSNARLEARVHDLERELAELRADVHARNASEQCATVHDVSVPAATTFDSVVPFDVSESRLQPGDRIVIREVRGTRPRMEVDGMYLVRGEYTLASADQATLSFTVRATDPKSGCTSNDGRNRFVVTRGSGTFELATRAAYKGDADISFFRQHHHDITTGDDALSSVYFAKVSDPRLIDTLNKAASLAQCKPVDISFPASTTFPAVVPFDIGRTELRPGDRITIREVRGTSSDFVVGGIYQVRGDYTLTSADEAVLGLNVTGGCTSGIDRGQAPIKKGSGTFDLAVKVAYVGQPHVTFYVNGQGAGGVYFGKGDFLAR